MIDPDTPLMTAEEIEAIFAPYVRRTLVASDPLVRRLRRQYARRWLVGYLRTLIRRGLTGWRRRPTAVREHYDRVWDALEWRELRPDYEVDYLMRIGERYALGNVWGISRIHLAILNRVVEAVRPRRVLEVGSGRGLNLILLAARHPDIEFAGLELSTSGVIWAQTVDADPELPPELVDFAPFDLPAERLPGRVQFVQGSALDMPFSDGQFDLVFTRQALEQMESIRPLVFEQIHRVCSGYGAFIEAFRDWNERGTLRHRIVALDYFAARIADLHAYGFEPILTDTRLPVKTYMSVGLVLAQRSARTESI